MLSTSEECQIVWLLDQRGTGTFSGRTAQGLLIVAEPADEELTKATAEQEGE